MINIFLKIFLVSSALLGIFFFNSCKDNPTDNGGKPIIGDPPVYPSIDGFPAWSPDGKYIIYNHYGITRIDIGGSYNVNSDSAGLWLVNADGTNPHIILKGDDINADWSPDGKWIVFEINAQIYKVPFNESGINTSEIIQLTFEGRNFFPDWNHTGKKIAYNQTICEDFNP